MMAMMLVASATAFAGDSDALKAILKAKDYAEAQSLIRLNRKLKNLHKKKKKKMRKRRKRRMMKKRPKNKNQKQI